jgi:hypothetical protein
VHKYAPIFVHIYASDKLALLVECLPIRVWKYNVLINPIKEGILNYKSEFSLSFANLKWPKNNVFK